MPDFLPALRTKRAPVGLQTTALPQPQSRKEILLAGYYAQTGGVTGVPGRGWNFDRAVRDGYSKVVWVYRSVEAISGNQARLPAQIKDGEHPLDDHPVLRLLNGAHANPVESGRRFRKRLSQQVLLSPKGAFVEVGRSRGNTPVRFDLLPPGRTKPIPDPKGEKGILRYELYDRNGAKSRDLDPANVLWVGEPHPSDPYACQTPLEAAGLTVELDHFARLFNRQFMANDGRPGGILGLTDPAEDIDEAEMDRVERKFGGGPLDAGRLVVLASGLSYVDVAKTPRDGQWHEAMDRGKDEILVAFGVPESQIGHAANSSFLNGEVEAVAFWQITMLPHNDLILSAFAPLVDDEHTLAFDVSSVDALHLAEQKRRAELREEWNMGLLSADAYLEATGRDPYDVPGSRVLWIPAGRVPVALTSADQEAAEKLAPLGTGTQAAPLRAGAVPDQSPVEAGIPSGNDRTALPGGGGQSDARAIANEGYVEATHPAAHGRERKMRRTAGPTSVDDKEDDRARVEAEDAVTTALTEVATRTVEQAVGRVSGAKVRKGTRHERPGAAGTKALPAEAVVDPEAAGQQAYAAALDALTPYAQQYAERMQDYLANDGVDTTQPPEPPEDSGDAAAVAAAAAAAALVLPTPGPTGLVTPAITAAIEAAAETVRAAAIARAERLRERVRTADDAGADMTHIVAALRGTHSDDRAPAGSGDALGALRGLGNTGPWARSLATGAVTAALEGARDVVLRAAGDRVHRTWRTMRDDRVRQFHRDAEGQTVAGDDTFTVGGEDARYPGDPLLSPANRINCRCKVGYTLALGGRTARFGRPEQPDRTTEGKAAFDPAKHPRGGDPHHRGEFSHVPGSGLAHAVEHAVESAAPRGRAHESSSPEHDLDPPTGLVFRPRPGQTHARCRHGEALPVSKFPTTSGGLRGTECRTHRDARRKTPGRVVPPPVEKKPESTGAHVHAVEAARSRLPDNRADLGRRRVKLDEHPRIAPGLHNLEVLRASEAFGPAALRQHYRQAFISQRGYDPVGDPEGERVLAEDLAGHGQHVQDLSDMVNALREQWRRDPTYDPATDTVSGGNDIDGSTGRPGVQTREHLQAVRDAGAAIAAEVDRRLADRDFAGQVAAAAQRETEATAALRATPDYRDLSESIAERVAREHGVGRMQYRGMRRGYDGIDANGLLDGQPVQIGAQRFDGTVNVRDVDRYGVAKGQDWRPVPKDAVESLPYWGGTGEAAQKRREMVAPMEKARKDLFAAVDAALEGDTEHARAKKAYDAAYKERQDAIRAHVVARQAQRVAERDAMLAVLTEVRDMGARDGTALRLKQSTGKGVKAVREAERFYPTEWIAANSAPTRSTLDVKTSKNGRGNWKSWLSRLTLGVGNGHGLPDQPEYTRVAVHEVGHSMEDRVPGVKVLEHAFHFDRTSEVDPLTGHVARNGKNALRPMPGYKRTEQARQDDYIEVYTGKEYGGSPNSNYEIITTAMESLFAGSPYVDSRGSGGRRDDSLREFTLGLLGVL